MVDLLWTLLRSFGHAEFDQEAVTRHALLFLHAPRLVLRKPPAAVDCQDESQSSVRRVVRNRLQKAEAGEWLTLANEYLAEEEEARHIEHVHSQWCSGATATAGG